MQIIHLSNLFRSLNFFLISPCFCVCIYGEIIFANHRSENRDPGISRGLALSVALHLTDETDICDRTDSSRVRLRFGSDYGMRVCTCMIVRLASQYFKAKCRRSLISTKTSSLFSMLV